MDAIISERTAGEPSLWEARGPLPPGQGALSGSRFAETVVVGAGVAGLSTAFHLAREGREVVVLEAGWRPAAATGASAGIVTGQIVRRSPADVLRRLGADAGLRLVRAIAESPRYTFDLIREEAILCEAEQAGFLAPFWARGARGAQKIAADWADYRDDVVLLDATDTAALSGARGYAGAILDRSGGGIDPVAFADGLAQCLIARGGTVHRNSAVIAIERATSGRWRVRTSGGDVVAGRVILCANGGNAALHPRLAGSVLPLPVCEMATPPLSKALQALILPQRHVLTDISTDVFSIRYDAANRLITACPAPENIDRAQLERATNRRLRAMLPAWTDMPLESVWVGTAWLVPDLLPRLVAVDDGIIGVQACNGRGLAINTLAGREVAGWVMSDGAGRTSLPLGPPRRVSGFALARHVPKLMMGAARLGRSLMQRS